MLHQDAALVLHAAALFQGCAVLTRPCYQLPHAAASSPESLSRSHGCPDHFVSAGLCQLREPLLVAHTCWHPSPSQPQPYPRSAPLFVILIRSRLVGTSRLCPTCPPLPRSRSPSRSTTSSATAGLPLWSSLTSSSLTSPAPTPPVSTTTEA